MTESVRLEQFLPQNVPSIKYRKQTICVYSSSRSSLRKRRTLTDAFLAYAETLKILVSHVSVHPSV